MKKHFHQQSRTKQPRGFEALEPRYALDGFALQLAAALPLPTNLAVISTNSAAPTSSAAPAITATLPALGMRIYTAPIGPVRALVTSVAATTAATRTTLLPMTLSANPQFGTTVLPMGPVRSVPAAAAPGLYAEGFLPTNQTPTNLPTQIERIPAVNEPPGPPTFTLAPSFPLY